MIQLENITAFKNKIYYEKSKDERKRRNFSRV